MGIAADVHAAESRTTAATMLRRRWGARIIRASLRRAGRCAAAAWSPWSTRSRDAPTSGLRRRRAPEISSLDGTGTTDGADGHAAQHVHGSLVILGANFDGAGVSLSGGTYDNLTLEPL